MPQLVTFSRKDDPHGTPCFGRLDGDAITDLTDSFKGRFSSLSDAANAGALDTLFDASGPAALARENHVLDIRRGWHGRCWQLQPLWFTPRSWVQSALGGGSP